MLGKDEKDENYMFAEINDVKVGKSENIFVLDRKNCRVQVYDKNGKFLKGIGRKGQGPGEFFVPSFISLDKNERLFVVDYRKVHIFDEKGEFIKTFKIDFRAYNICVIEDKILLLGYKNDKIFHYFDFNGNYLESFGNISMFTPESQPIKYKEYYELMVPMGFIVLKDNIYVVNQFEYKIVIFKDKKLVDKIERSSSYFPKRKIVERTYERGVSLGVEPWLFCFISGHKNRIYISLLTSNGNVIDIFKDKEYIGSIKTNESILGVDEKGRLYLADNTDIPILKRCKLTIK
ncbi:MAG: 6-bladed beta-propeller [Acidobacteriota bacterium]